MLTACLCYLPRCRGLKQPRLSLNTLITAAAAAVDAATAAANSITKTHNFSCALLCVGFHNSAGCLRLRLQFVWQRGRAAQMLLGFYCYEAAGKWLHYSLSISEAARTLVMQRRVRTPRRCYRYKLIKSAISSLGIVHLCGRSCILHCFLCFAPAINSIRALFFFLFFFKSALLPLIPAN